MLRLQRRLISAVLAVSSATLGRRILSADPGRRFMSTAPASIARFDPDDYLVARCGLTPEQAREASKRLTRLKSPSNPDAVRAFLAGRRIPYAAVATVVARHPQILCFKVGETLAPRVAELREIGLSPGEISRLVTICPELLLSRLRVSRLEFYFSLLLGSCDRVLVALENNAGLLEQSLAGVVKPNLAFLRKAFHVHNMVRAIDLAPRLLTAPQERLDAVVARGEECRRIGRPCKFLLYAALIADQSLLQKEVAAKVELLTSLGLSSCQVGVWASWIPDWFLKRSEKLLQRTADFLTKEVGLEADTIARHLILFQYSMDKRLVPRFNVLKILMEEGLLDDARKRFADPMRISVATFEDIFVHPYEDSIPALARAYAPFRADDPPWGRTLPSLAFEDWCHNWGLTKIPVKRNPL